MATNDIKIKYQGDFADDHKIPAYLGSKSVFGITRGFDLITHYLSTGKIKTRYPFSDDIQLNWTATKPGSLETIYEIVISNPVAVMGGGAFVVACGSAAGKDAYKLTKDFFTLIFKSATGKDRSLSEEQKEIIEIFEKVKPDEMDALIKVMGNSLKNAHHIIGNGVSNISIVGNQNTIVFDQSTKNYINTNIFNDEEEWQDVSVSSLNANTGYGKVYMHDLKRLVSFQVLKDHEPHTFSNLSYSLNRYTDKKPSDIEINFFRVVSSDGTTKKLLIKDAKKIEEN